ncbi:MAG: ABC transporter permease [Cyclobacteriaceae bacterium]|nr:ABC transporter permease [Cyclobacteriaceae bacterium]UYN88167.1 MAG: ABC transporter permease [Cyclobacteriaceae bacterium]
MLKNYFTIAIRNILKHRIFSFINIFGLAVAMSICMAIMMLVADQMMYDRYNPDRDRIYRITTRMVDKNNKLEIGNPYATATLPVRDELLNNFTGVEKAVRIMRGFGNNWLELEPSFDVNVPISGYFVDAEMLEVFKYELLYGDSKSALVNPYSVVLTKKAAEKLFKEENPLGQSFKVGELGIYTVTGVLKDNGNKSHIAVEAFASISTVPGLVAEGKLGKDLDNWYNFTMGWVYVVLERGKTPHDIQLALDKIYVDHFTELPNADTQPVKFSTQPLMSITPGEMLNNPIGPFMPWMIIYFLMGLAGIVLLTSCFNFTNLSIARSLGRAREIGVRKVTGAARWQIFIQFVNESVVVALFALVMAFGILMFIKPHMLDLAFARALRWDLEGNYFVYIVFLLFAIVVGVLAGLFPAGVLSGFQPIQVLKNLGNTRLMSKMGLRKALLVVQFTFSMIFIISVIVLFNQLQLFVNIDNGFDSKDKIIVRTGEADKDRVKHELLKYPEVLTVSAASHIPAAGIVYGHGFKKQLTDSDWLTMNYFSVDEDYLHNMDIELVAGRFYDGQAGESNRNFIVINEEAVRAFHYGSNYEALGQVIINQPDSTEKQIIGVVKDYNHEMFAEKLGPLALMFNPAEYSILQVGYTGNYLQAKEKVEKVWASLYPELKSDIRAFDEEMNSLYDIVFGTLVKVLGFITFLAIVISCLGLLGMATYTVETRKKEIALRKVLGSSNQSLVLILSKGYLSILLLAMALAIPVAYFINNLWLQNFAFHVSVDLLTIALSVFVLLLFGGITIGSQTLQAAFINPVENLKNE